MLDRPDVTVPRPGSDVAPIVVLILFATLCHAPMLAMRGIYFDGWLINAMETDGRRDLLLSFFSELGFPLFGYYHWSISRLLSDHLGYNLISFASLVTSTIFFYKALKSIPGLSCRESLFSALLFCCYTAFQVPFDISLSMYIVCLPLFVTACYLMSFGAGAPRRVHLAIAPLTALLLFISFHTMSLLLVFAYILLIRFSMESAERTFRQRVYSFSHRYGMYILIAILFISLKYTIWRPYGLYLTYNKPSLDLRRYVDGVEIFVINSVWEQFRHAFLLAVQSPVTFCVLALALFCGLLLLGGPDAVSRLGRHGRGASEATPHATMGVANIAVLAVAILVLFLVAVTPYVLVGKPAESSGWETRHALLMGFPVSLALVLLWKMLGPVLNKHAPLVGSLGACAVLAGFTLATWTNYGYWELRAIKDSAIISNLRKLSPDIYDKTSYVYVIDRAVIPRTGQYTYIDYAGIFKEGWGDEARVGAPAQNDTNLVRLTEALPLERYALKNLRQGGCAAILRIRSDAWAHYSPREVLWRYFSGSVLGRANEPDFLASLVQLEWTSLSDERVAALGRVRDAFEAFKHVNGRYPLPPGAAPGQVSVSRPEEWIQQLVPTYLPAIPGDRHRIVEADDKYLYLSDGHDYKLVAHGVEDVRCIVERSPDLMDPRRPTYAYGLWSPAARNW